MNRHMWSAAFGLALALFATANGRVAGRQLPSPTDATAESIVRAYLEAFKALDAATMVSDRADDARTIRDGQSIPVNRNQGDMRAFERATHTIWTYRIDRVAGESVTVTLTEDNDFYRALGVGTRTQQLDYVVRNGKIAEIRPISMRDEHGVYRDEYQRFLKWLVQQPSGNDPDIVKDGDFLFNEHSGSKMQPWFSRYRSVQPEAAQRVLCFFSSGGAS